MRNGNDFWTLFSCQFFSDLGSLWGRFGHPIGGLEEQFWTQNGGTELKVLRFHNDASTKASLTAPPDPF